MNKEYHLIGIGGIGMSGIACLLLRSGHIVTGSDLKENKNIVSLRRLGAKICIGHDKKNIIGNPVVVYSSAIKDDNPEIIEAKKRSLPLIKRAQALAELMTDKTVIAIAGSHGKTTTASLVSCLLLEAGLSPTLAIGGILKNIDTNACIGNGDYFVAEADESDGSFLYYNPRYSIVTNIDHEHLDYYKTFNNELKAFRDFFDSTSNDGAVFCCSDDKNLQNLAKEYKNKVITFGFSKGSDIYPKNILFKGLSSEFDCFLKSKFISRFSLGLGGEHNISNSLSVIALGLKLGIDIKLIKAALSGYKGAGRRLELKFKDGNYTLLDDYAHHPSEIKATLKAVSYLKPKRKIVIFQPHRYTRTKLLLNEFSRSFAEADILFITEIYPAGEKPIPGIDSKMLSLLIKDNCKNKLVYFSPKSQVIGRVIRLLKPKDLVITMGAGDISRISDELAEELKSKI